MATERFFRAVHLSGLELFVWLTNAQVHGASDSWNEDRVVAYEDRGGEMVPRDVLISDLDIVEEV
jgi:hypothetical protein